MKQLTMVMLFGDLSRFSVFAKARFHEATTHSFFSEIIFVINQDDENTRKEVVNQTCSLSKDIKLIFNSENNIPQGRNLGISHSQNEFIFIWDDDDSLIDFEALQEAFSFFVENNLPIMEVPMVFPDGAEFHPQKVEVMPQIPSGISNLLLIGMMHTPFFLKKETWQRVPIPEYVPLRGDWLHWSALLWNAKIPVTCWIKSPVMMEGIRQRANGATASGNGEEAKIQAFTSLITLFALHSQLTGYDKESTLVKTRYFDKFCKEENVWKKVVIAGKFLDLNIYDVNITKAQNIVRKRLRGNDFHNFSLKPYQAVMEPRIAQEMFKRYIKSNIVPGLII